MGVRRRNAARGTRTQNAELQARIDLAAALRWASRLDFGEGIGGRPHGGIGGDIGFRARGSPERSPNDHAGQQPLSPKPVIHNSAC